MTIGLLFWILMIIWFVFDLAWNYGVVPGTYGPWGRTLFFFILFVLLGWQAFGAPIRG